MFNTETEGTTGGTGERLMRMVESASQGDGGGPYLVVDLGRAFRYLRGEEGTLIEEAATELTEDDAGQSGGGRRLGRRLLVLAASIALSYALRSRYGPSEAAETADEPLTRIRESTDTGGGGDGGSRGRGVLSKLLVLGAVVGIGLVLRRRATSPEEAAEEAAEETESLAERAAQTVRRRGEVVAERIEEGTGVIAERVEEGGETTAEQLDETADAIEEAEDQAVEQAEEIEEEARQMAEETEGAVEEMESEDGSEAIEGSDEDEDEE